MTTQGQHPKPADQTAPAAPTGAQSAAAQGAATGSTPSPSRPASVNREHFKPFAGLMAILFPGAGHFVLGERWRAFGVAVGVLGLFFGGILIGGIDAVDRREDRIWFLGQALVGPIAFGVDFAHQNWYKGYVPGDEDNPPQFRTAHPGEVREMRPGPGGGMRPTLVPGDGPTPNSKSLAHVNEIGTLYATIAGMLNLIAILDAFFHREHREEIPA